MRFLFTLFFVGLLYPTAIADLIKLPLQIDHDYFLPTQLYLEFEAANYNNEKIEDLSKNRQHEEDVFFATLFEAIITNNYDAAKTLLLEDETEEENSYDNFENIFLQYQHLVQKVQATSNITVKSKIFAGNNLFYIWGAKGMAADPQLLFFRAFNIRRKQPSGFGWSQEYPPLISLLTTAYTVHANEIRKDYTTEKASFQYKIPIYGQDSKKPVTLLFDGFHTSFDVFNDKNDNEVLTFYQSAYTTLTGADHRQFATFYTEKSRLKFQDWQSRMTEEEFELFRNDIRSKGRNVTFVMDLAPFYIVFYRYNTESTKKEFVHYDYIIKTPNEGFRLTNLYYTDSLDQILNSPEFQRGLQEDSIRRKNEG